MIVQPDDWQPADGLVLEPAALEVVKSSVSYKVTAGPGAGKTELLAQRACYLLQTGECPAPRRILAISFKKDSASNLRKRVEQRGRGLAKRLDSLTYEGFAKRLLDQFLRAVPAPYTPSPVYEIPPKLGHRLSAFAKAQDEFLTKYERTVFLRDHALRLPLRPDELTAKLERLAVSLWEEWVGRAETSTLSFPMISRLAEFVLRSNPLILGSLRATYSHVFLDEYQDTTAAQFDLTETAFGGTEVPLTAVGDDKQRIMIWAGALPDAFDRFQETYAATPAELALNHRSAPRLVEVQRVVAAALNPETAPVYSGPTAPKEGVAEAQYFANPEQEAALLATDIAAWIAGGLPGREICILVKSKAPTYAKQILEALQEKGVNARIEQELQELLTEPVSELVLAALVLATRTQAPESWERLSETHLQCLGLTPEESSAEGDAELGDLLAQIKAALAGLPAGAEAAQLLPVLEGVVAFIGREAFRECNPQYRSDEWLDKKLGELADELLARRARPLSWDETVDDLLGKSALPIMTIHKSKGLEYHTVIFLGLEDGAFWAFDKQSDEDTRSFFVALSRAKSRVLFTFSHERDSGWDDERVVERTKKIEPLFQYLADAGVEWLDRTEEG